MRFCMKSEHILDEILIFGKVQIIVSAHGQLNISRSDKTDRRSKYTGIRIFANFHDRTDVWLQLESELVVSNYTYRRARGQGVYSRRYLSNAIRRRTLFIKVNF